MPKILEARLSSDKGRNLRFYRSVDEEADRSVRSYAAGLEGDMVVGLMPTMTRCALAPAVLASSFGLRDTELLPDRWFEAHGTDHISVDMDGNSASACHKPMPVIQVGV